MQGFTCNGQQTQAEKEKKNQEVREEQQGANYSNWKEASKVLKKQEKEENRYRFPMTKAKWVCSAW